MAKRKKKTGSSTARVARLRTRRAEAGLVELRNVWVPAEHAGTLRSLIDMCGSSLEDGAAEGIVRVRECLILLLDRPEMARVPKAISALASEILNGLWWIKRELEYRRNLPPEAPVRADFLESTRDLKAPAPPDGL